jgi:cyclohexanecarboxylate-CoA ligase
MLVGVPRDVDVPRLVATRHADPSYLFDGTWEGRTICSFLDEASHSRPRMTAVVDGATTLTYDELARRADALAAALFDLGVEPGRSVLIQLPNWWETIVAMHAVARIGAVANPVVPIYRGSEVGFIVGQSRPAAAIVPHRFRGFDYVEMFAGLRAQQGGEIPLIVARPDSALPSWAHAFDDVMAGGRSISAAADDPDDVVLLLYTSGTTASPKGVLHNHQTLVYECRSIIELCRLGADDHIFMASPVTHITGFLYGFVLPSMTGAEVVLLDVWAPGKAFELIERFGCRFTVAATPFLQGLTEEYERRAATSSLATFACGGADVPPELVRRAALVLGSHVCRVYGSSEFPTFSCGRPDGTEREWAETDGFPIGPVSGRLDAVDEEGIGELLVRGPELFLGYLDGELNADSFTADGSFRTGDLASFDAAGCVTIQGRKKDIILRKGENISAREVEDHLYAHEHIADVAVIALPDPVSGERACAVVVTDGAVLTLQDLQEYLEARAVAKQKWPEQMVLADSLPRTASGKVQKFVLRQQLGDRR